jgi:hypothetical protein
MSLCRAGVSRFEKKTKSTDEQGWEDVPPGSAIEGLLLTQPPGKIIASSKSSRGPATPEQLARLGNDRASVVRLKVGTDKGIG